MPSVKEGETRQQFMSRCVPMRHKEHPTEDNKQSVAVCFSMWREQNKKKASLDDSEAAKKKKKSDEDNNDGRK